jgi:hypothetical protein
MTDPIDYDALLSRVLDGEATPAERAQVAADGSLTARLDLLRRTQQRLAEPPPALDDATVDELVARALREMPLQEPVAPQPVAAAPTAPPQGPPVAAEPLAPVPAPTSLAAHREKKNRTPLILSVAAAVLVVLLAVPVIATLAGDDGGSDSSNVEQADAPDSADDGAADSAEGDAMQEADDLDQVAGLLALADPLNEGGGNNPPLTEDEDDETAAEGTPTTTVPGDQPTPGPDGVPTDVDPLDYCRGVLSADHPDLEGDEVRGAIIRFQGEEAVAYLYEEDGNDVVLVASAATCDILDGPSPA